MTRIPPDLTIETGIHEVTHPPVAFLSQGKLLQRTETGGLAAIESAFGQSLRQRAAEIRNRHAWKTAGRGAQFMGLGHGSPGDGPAELNVRINSVCAGREKGSLLYTLQSDEIGGIFAVDSNGVEDRLFHTADFRLSHLSISPNRGEVAVSVSHPDFSSSIAVMTSEGAGFQEVTEGESIDLAPSWVHGAGRTLVFQSAGIARDRAGLVRGLGPTAIQRLDLESGELATQAEEDAHDLLSPHLLADGSLLYIRRPYESQVRSLHPLQALKDAALFPFRMAHALFQYFNFFSIRYTGKPLETSRGAAARHPDPRQMMIWGNLVDAEQAGRAAGGPDKDAPDMVPSSWQLTRRDPAGATQVLAQGVLSFDVSSNGDVYYSNGSAIYQLAHAGGRPERLMVSKWIEQVSALG